MVKCACREWCKIRVPTKKQEGIVVTTANKFRKLVATVDNGNNAAVPVEICCDDLTPEDAMAVRELAADLLVQAVIRSSSRFFESDRIAA